MTTMNFAELIQDWLDGDRAAGEVLFKELGRELRLIASAQLRRERSSSLSSRDLVNEAVLRLARTDRLDVKDRAHVLAIASRLMRQILVDHSRKRNSDKRNAHPVTLHTGIGHWEQPIELMDFERALVDLQEIDAERAKIVEMRFFGGMTIEDVASVLEMSERTVKRRWSSARTWLRHRLDSPTGALGAVD